MDISIILVVDLLDLVGVQDQLLGSLDWCNFDFGLAAKLYCLIWYFKVANALYIHR